MHNPIRPAQNPAPVKTLSTARTMDRSNSVRRTAALLAALAILTAAALILTSCAAPGGTTTATTAAPATTQPTTAPTAAPNETTTNPGATTPLPINAVEQALIDRLERYREQLPAGPEAKPAAESRQTQLVNGMVNLYNLEASSREIHSLYLEGIGQLEPERADTFTAYAIASLRRNSFMERVDISRYTKDPLFFDRFLAEGKRVDYHYAEFSRNPEQIKDSDIKAMVLDARDRGYVLAMAEGSIFYVVDFTIMASHRTANTQPMADLLLTLGIDTLDPLASDGAFIVDRETLAARTYQLEQMLGASRAVEATAVNYLAVRYADHLTMLLFGIDNTPTFDFASKQLTTEAKTLFNGLATIETSLTAALVRDFLSLVEKAGGRVTDDVYAEMVEKIWSISPLKGMTEAERNAYGDWMSGVMPVTPD
jgi:hypothetical protein